MAYLVGAGPGGPELLTLGGRDALARADAVLFDKLVDPRILAFAPPDALREDVGKRYDIDRNATQEAIHRRMIELARAGKTVVRLKGGDPLLFARGGEEAAALAAAGVPFAILPGVTAALAAAASAGIPLTHRAYASAVAFVAGHEEPGKADGLDYAALAKFPGTLVHYMPLARRQKIAAALLAAGKAGSTPVAFVENAGHNRQRVVETTLAEVAGNPAIAAELKSPALAIVGDVCAWRRTLHWREQRPLAGVRILLPQDDAQADRLATLLDALGAVPLREPALRILPPDDWTDVDARWARAGGFGWIAFASRHGVKQFLGRMWEQGGDARRLGGVKLAAIGPGTAAALAEFRLHADLVPAVHSSEGLAAELAPLVAGQRVLLVRANRGRDVLAPALAAAGALPETVVAYRQEDVPAPPPGLLEALAETPGAWVALTSPAMAATVGNWLAGPERTVLRQTLRCAAISPLTAAAARHAGLNVAAVAESADFDGLVAALCRAAAVSAD